MQNQHKIDSIGHECMDGRCPTGIDSVKKIGLTPKEKRAIFFYLKKVMRKERVKAVELSTRPT